MYAAKALALSMLVWVTPALAQEGGAPALDDIPHITMVGTAPAEAAPDIATISLGVVTEKPSAEEAANENARKAKDAIAAAKAHGVAAADIATQSLTLMQTFDEVRDPQGRVTGQRPRGFAAENIVTIRICTSPRPARSPRP